jgi:tetratricopeptide (TPR) repeat protein
VWPYWVARGRLDEGRGWLAQLLARTDDDSPHRPKALYGAGVIASLKGDAEAARRLLGEALAAAGDRELRADCLVSLARVAMLERDPVTMERRARESAEAARAVGDERRYATALHHVGEALRRQRRYDEAAPLFREAIERHRALADRRSVALELHNLGRLTRQTGDAVAAAGLFRESLALAVDVGHERLVAYCLLGLATIAAEEGELARAATLVGAADARLAAVGAALEPEYVDERAETLRRARAYERDRAAGFALGLEESARLGQAR